MRGRRRRLQRLRRKARKARIEGLQILDAYWKNRERVALASERQIVKNAELLARLAK